MLERTRLFDLFFHRPHAFTLLSYLKLVSAEKKSPKFWFCPKDLRDIGSRCILTKEQVKRNLKLLHERQFITLEKCDHRPQIYEITLNLDEDFNV